MASKFQIPIAVEKLQEVDATLDAATVTLVQGLVFHALKSAADKEKLRASVVSALNLLSDRKIGRDRLTVPLKKKAEAAMRFQVVPGKLF